MTGCWPPEVLLAPDPDALAELSAARLLVTVADAVALRGRAHVALTGGGIGIGMLRALAVQPALRRVDWTCVDLWFGDERYVAADSPDRNDGQARAALLDQIDARVHRIAALGEVADLEAAVADYTARLAEVDTFDVTLLGVGPEGHVDSLFPDTAAVRSDAAVVGVRDSPKPPPERVSLTLPRIRRSRQVWVLASGEQKAPALARALAGASEVDVPVAGARGTERTLWLVDPAAAPG